MLNRIASLATPPAVSGSEGITSLRCVVSKWSSLLLLVTVPLVALTALLNDNAWLASSDGPREMFVAQPATDFGPDPAVTVWFAPGVNDGASFTATTLTASAVSTLAPPESVARTVSTAEPLAFAAGCKVRIPPATETVPNRFGLVFPTTA